MNKRVVRYRDFVLLALLWFGEALFRFALDRKKIAPQNAPQADEGWLVAEAQDCFLVSADRLRLHAFLVEAPGNDWAICLHGYTGRAQEMAGQARRFREMGFHVLAPDARAHGRSEGRYVGMGWPDRLDVLRWIDFILQLDPRARIGLYGVSMGAATALMTAGEDLPGQVHWVVADCAYTSAWDEFRHELKQGFHVPVFPFLYIADFFCRRRAKYGFREASALAQVKKCRLPALFIHGEADDFVPYWMMDALYMGAPGEKERLSVPGAAHALSSQQAPDLYWQTVESFVRRHA